MIPQPHEGGVEVDGLVGERAHFTIKPNGKAFRILIDGLYSNKVRSIMRELWANAADAHVAAGKPDTQFHVDLPTNLDQTFRVRDYGTGMTHNEVMHLYTTIFESSKEGTNEQTGMLGLGSKSPFAYTDTFSVMAYDGVEKRVYIANIESDGVPAITHVETVACDEPRGIEVAFPVKRQDMNQFVTEAQWVSIGFKVKPTISGAEIKMPTPRLSGNGWAIYPNNSFGYMTTRSLVRQGVVVYPNDTIPIGSLGYGFMSIVDIPLGTADVTASRESLSYTATTQANVKAIVDRVGAEIHAQIWADINSATTRIGKALKYAEFNGVLSNLKGSADVSLLRNEGDYTVRAPGDTMWVANTYHKKGTTRRGGRKEVMSIPVTTISGMRLIVDDGEKMVRKMQRLQLFARSGDYFLPMNSEDPGNVEGLKWLKSILELKDSQIVSLKDTFDPGPEESSRERAAYVKKALAAGQYWMLRKNSATETVYGVGNVARWDYQSNYEGWPRGLTNAHAVIAHNGISTVRPDSILYVTPLQAERMDLPKSRRFDMVVQKQLAKEAAALDLDQALAIIALDTQLGRGRNRKLIGDEFFPEYTMTSDKATEIVNKASVAHIPLTDETIADTIKTRIMELGEKYPLLFGRDSLDVYKNYIKQVNAATQEEVSV